MRLQARITPQNPLLTEVDSLEASIVTGGWYLVEGMTCCVRLNSRETTSCSSTRCRFTYSSLRLRARFVGDESSTESCRYHRYAIEKKQEIGSLVKTISMLKKGASGDVKKIERRRFLPLMDVDGSMTSVAPMLLDDDDPVDVEAPTSAKGDEACDARVVVCESSEMSTM